MTTATNPVTSSRADVSASLRARQNWYLARPWQTNAALLLIGTALFFLSRQLVSEYDHFTIGFSGVSGWSCILFLAAAFLILTQPVDRFTFPIILAVAIACRLAVLFSEAYLSSDIYRYIWDGIVQHAHISPYRYVPGDPILASLRAPNQDIFDNINRRDYAHTIYPPAAQALFYLITWISPTVAWMKTVMVLFEGVTMCALITLLRYLGVRREQTLLYAWCPLVIWEIAGSGHLDSAAMAFIALALLARYRKQPILTGLFLAIAILLKLYPLVLLPALYRRGDFKMPATVAAVIAFGYAAYSSVGPLVFGFLGGYVKEEGMATGSRYFLLELAQRIPSLHGLTTTAYFLFCAAIFAAILWWCWQIASQQGIDGHQPATNPSTTNPSTTNPSTTNPSTTNPGTTNLGTTNLGTTNPSTTNPGAPCPAVADMGSHRSSTAFLRPAFALASTLMFLFSPHYAWYILWLVPFFTLMPSLPILTYLLGFFYLYTTALAEPGPKMFLANEILYAAVLAAFIIQLVLKRWPIHRTLFLQHTTASEPL
jgi:alpha-1,6-mannosyltransferase